MIEIVQHYQVRTNQAGFPTDSEGIHKQGLLVHCLHRDQTTSNVVAETTSKSNSQEL